MVALVVNYVSTLRLTLLVVAACQWFQSATSSRADGPTEPNKSHEVLFLSPSLGMRLPPDYEAQQSMPCRQNDNANCKGGALCVGPIHDHYPIGHQPGVLFTSRFQVPPLPNNYNSYTMTYYDYYNIFWRQQPNGGIMNQFIPQLMLGNVLANSTNYPIYDPKWLVLDQWHIGAQYFFALPSSNFSSSNSSSRAAAEGPSWTAKAATGKLIPVNPGEFIETTFTLVQVADKNDWEWHLRMGAVGGHPKRWSLVVVRTPFMGLVPNTKWQDEIYQNVTVGSCLENYNMHQSANFPKTWQIAMDVIVPTNTVKSTNPIKWDDWRLAGTNHCSWQPQTTLESVEGSTWQRATWNATLAKQQASTLE